MRETEPYDAESAPGIALSSESIATTYTWVYDKRPVKNPNLTWKEFSANEVSHSMAHYLVTLRDLRATQGYARQTDIADELGVTKGTVSQQIRHLKERGYVVEDKAHHLDLTEAGHSVARQVVYNRGTLIRFLNKVLCVDPNQAEVDACKMEHLLSPITSHKLLGLVQLLLSDDPTAASLLERFSAVVAESNRKREAKRGEAEEKVSDSAATRPAKNRARTAAGRKTASRRAAGRRAPASGTKSSRRKSTGKSTSTEKSRGRSARKSATRTRKKPQ